MLPSVRRRPARSTGWLPAVLYALALHAVIVAVLVIGFRVVSRDEAPAQVIQAMVVREPSPDAKPEPEKLKQQEERKQREAEQQRVEQEQQRQETERQRVETERKNQEEEKKRQEQELRKKEEAERKKQVEADKRKQDEERKKVEKQRRQEAEAALREQLADEENSRAAARATKLAPQFDKYKTAIRQRVERNWAQPPISRKGLQCTVRIRQAVGGEVLEAKVVRSSGDAGFDRSVEAAVFKASPLPTPENPDLFARDIEFIFGSKD